MLKNESYIKNKPGFTIMMEWTDFMIRIFRLNKIKYSCFCECFKPKKIIHTYFALCFSFIMLFVLNIIYFIPIVHAQQAKLEGKFGDWLLYTRKTNKGQVCYVLTRPEDMSPKNVNHGQVYFLVSGWKSGTVKQQPSLLTGYSIKASNMPVISISNTRFNMYVSGKEAFIESSNQERKLIKKMKSGSIMYVKAVSSRGTRTSYQFSLKGVTAALNTMQKKC